jgi:hypothetical protein
MAIKHCLKYKMTVTLFYKLDIFYIFTGVVSYSSDVYYKTESTNDKV